MLVSVETEVVYSGGHEPSEIWCRPTVLWAVTALRVCCVRRLRSQSTAVCNCQHFYCAVDIIYSWQSKHNKIYCTVLYNMLYSYMFRPFFRPSSGCIFLALRVLYYDDKLDYFDDKICIIISYVLFLWWELNMDNVVSCVWDGGD